MVVSRELVPMVPSANSPLPFLPCLFLPVVALLIKHLLDYFAFRYALFSVSVNVSVSLVSTSGSLEPVPAFPIIFIFRGCPLYYHKS